MTTTASSSAEILRDTERAQALASDPTASAWVSANAGAGKTHVLKQRVLRILLTATSPDRILCLTYTKAAAAEMAGRVFRDLSQWATAEGQDLFRMLTKVLSRPPTEAEIALARSLFARAIETPGGLKVQTIHAFCEWLLQRFPLEAGVSPGFTILDDAETSQLQRQATDTVLTEATQNPSGALGRALAEVVAFAAGDAFDTLLRSALDKREWLLTAARLVRRDGMTDADAIAEVYRRALGIRINATRQSVEAELADVLPVDMMRYAASVIGGSTKKTDQELATVLLRAAMAQSDEARVAALSEAFLTGTGAMRADSRFITKAVREENPDVASHLCRARDRFADLENERRAFRALEASTALTRIAAQVMQHYARAKAERAAMDFDDLIEHTANLLADSDAAGWVLHKLDGGLDHILVDEAQDTSPTQWKVVEALATEFFPATGGQKSPRTIFAVGDEKQSIYSFQGAEPRMFAETGQRFRQAAEAAMMTLRRVPLNLSFRTVEPLLQAVDRVLSDRARAPGVTASDEPIRHIALRVGHAGGVEIWETEKPQDAEAVDAWLPLDEQTPSSPVVRLADRIAATIEGWLEHREMLASENRPIRAGDVLILLRKRNPFAGPMVAALKARGIPVAGADRLKLTEQIAVQDLIVLGDFLTLPEDDLALATVLKSPLIGLDDDDLLRLASGRKSRTLWSSLLDAAKTEPRYTPLADKLKRWRGIADQAPPFEFYAHVLDRDGGRKALISRLGPEAVETITEFLSLAIEFDASETPSLTGFLEWMRTGTREIKRDMEHGRNEVRVLTVHGSKGLEAPIVFLPDTTSPPGGRQQGKLVDLSDAGFADTRMRPAAWPVKGTSSLEKIKSAKETATAKDREEANRLLYVAMTRARDRLYVAGWETKNAPPKDCWYELIRQGLGEVLQESEHQGARVWHYRVQQSVDPAQASELAASGIEAIEPPEWSRKLAMTERDLAIPLAPSRLAPYDVDETGEPVEHARPDEASPPEPAAPSPLRLASGYRFQRGLITHALLEHLPALPPSGWDKAAAAFVNSRGTMLPTPVRKSIVAEVLALVRDQTFAKAFGSKSRAEVPLVALLETPGHKGPPLRLNAVIDRLVIDDEGVLIIDYKTNRPPPAEPAGVAKAYVVQLAAYRMALARMHPDKPVRAAILWTDGARLMELPAELLNEAETELWKLAKARLDAP